MPFFDFYIDAVLAGINPADAQAKSAAVERLLPLLEAAGDRIVQAHYEARIARSLGIAEREIVSARRKLATRSSGGVARQAAPSPISPRASNEDHLLALLLRHRQYTMNVIPLVPEEDIVDARNRELLRILREPYLPLDMGPESIIAGLDDAVADHAEALLERLNETPLQFPGQIERDARRALIRLGRERFDYLMRQLQSSISAAEDAEDLEALIDLRQQLASLYERHRQFYPPPSPYFRDSRDSDRPPAAMGR